MKQEKAHLQRRYGFSIPLNPEVRETFFPLFLLKFIVKFKYLMYEL